ncbi:MAG: hypothetical protein V4563_14575 [Pseudomonadota bacterium]
MKFESAATIESVCWQLRQVEYGRSVNRAQIDKLAAGWPPIDPAVAEAENIEVNSNDLSLTRLSHEARTNLYQAHFKGGSMFTCRTDMGPVHKRSERGTVVTNEVNRIIKRSMEYYELSRSEIAQDILHGIGIGVWNSRQMWCPDPTAITDVLIPTGTLLTFKNLPFFGICRNYTPEELYRLTHGPKVDKRWNVPVVMKSIAWAEKETSRLMGNTWQDTYWAPDKLVNRITNNSGFYASGMVQPISVIDFFFNDCESKNAGWRRAMIFDAWGGYSTYESGVMPEKNSIDSRNDFLYDGRDTVYADRMSEIIHFEFADLSPLAPFTYHGVRSLGHMLFDICHLQNRMENKFSEAVFEQLLQYFRVHSRDDAERALKIQLANRGIIDDSVEFIKAQDRWQPNAPLIGMGMEQNRRIIEQNSSAYTSNQFPKDKTERTKFEVQAQVNAMQTLVSAALQQSYRYKLNEYREIFRRFCMVNSRDPDVREFRVRCLKRGVPEKMLCYEAWDLESEQVIGGGNKTLEMAIAQQLMEWRPAYGAEAQQIILHDATLAITDNAAKARQLVPEQKTVSDAASEAMNAFGTLMVGGEKQWSPNANRTEIAQVLLGEYGLVVAQVNQSGGMATMPQVQGMANVSKHIAALLEQISQDKAQQQQAKMMQDALGKLDNFAKAFAQRLQEQQQSQNGDGGEKAKLMAEIQADMLKSKVKAQNQRESHAQRSAQRAAQFQLEQDRDDQRHAAEMQQELNRAQTEAQVDDIKTAAEIQRERAKTAAEIESEKAKAAAKPKDSTATS